MKIYLYSITFHPSPKEKVDCNDKGISSFSLRGTTVQDKFLDIIEPYPSPLMGERICVRMTQTSFANPDSERIEQARTEGSIAKLRERGANPRQGVRRTDEGGAF